MKKRVLPSFVAALAACAATTCAAHVEVVHQANVPDPGRRQGLTKEKFTAAFDACKFWLEYTIEDGKPVGRQWGDYFFGLNLGWAPGNGGWSRWCFMRVYGRSEKGPVRTFSMVRPKLFFGYSAEGADYVVAEWDEGEGKRFRLRFATFPSFRDWLFVRAEFDGFDLDRIGLVAYPGSVYGAQGRETHLMTRERDWTLNVEAADFEPATPLVMLGSRYFDERFGNKIVYDAAPVKSVFSGKSGGDVQVDFRPKEGAKSMSFALGYYADKEPEDQRVRFLGEDGDKVHDFLMAVDWEAAPKMDVFRKSVGVARELGVPLQELKPVVDRFKTARKACDVATVAACEAQVREMRAKAVAEGLVSFSEAKK